MSEILRRQGSSHPCTLLIVKVGDDPKLLDWMAVCLLGLRMEKSSLKYDVIL